MVERAGPSGYGHMRSVVIRAHPDAWLHPDGTGFVVRDQNDRPLGVWASSAARAWRSAYTIALENAALGERP